jgi:hypothetical protein
MVRVGPLKIDAVPLIAALEKIVQMHDAAARELEPGFTCGCKICDIAMDAIVESGATRAIGRKG